MTRRKHLSLHCLAIAIAMVVGLLPLTLAAGGFDELDHYTERCLTEGEILKKENLRLDGVTRPQRLTIDCDGEQRHAVIKTVDERKLGITRFTNGTWEVNFSDSFRYERAAYLLDRQLGLDMVPVVVIREDRRGEFALVEWIEGASYERDSPHRPSARERAKLARQKALMRLFDALIYNTDRNTQNYLVDDRDWRLYLIDHGRAFRQTKDLPEGWKDTLFRLPSDLYERLKSLEEEDLAQRLDGSISRRQIRSLLERRDKIIQEIDADRQRHGDEVVFSG